MTCYFLNVSRRNTTSHRLYSLTNLRIPGTASLSEDVAPLEPLPDGFHSQYTQIEYECASPLYQHFGSARRTCLRTGKWSGNHVSCSPGEGSTELSSRTRITAESLAACVTLLRAGFSITKLFMISKACLCQDRWCTSQASINLVSKHSVARCKERTKM